MDELVGHLNKLGVKENGAVKQCGASHHRPTNILDPVDSSDEDDDDDEEEDYNSGNIPVKSGVSNKRLPNDGTLLASDPPKPLYIYFY